MQKFFLFFFLVSALSSAQGREFLRSDFFLGAYYEDLAGNKYSSETATGQIRISSDGMFCRIDLPELSKDTIPCSINYAYSSNFGIEIDNEAVVALYKKLVRKNNPWPVSYLARFDELLWSYREDLEIGNAIGYETSLLFQLHDNTSADAVHLSIYGGNQWEAY